MHALFDYSATFKDDHVIGIGRVRHAVCDHQHGSARVGERANRPQNQGFAFHIDAAGSLVENIDGRPSQQYARDRDALLLPARQVAAVLCDRHVEFLRLRAHEIVDMRGLERLP